MFALSHRGLAQSANAIVFLYHPTMQARTTMVDWTAMGHTCALASARVVDPPEIISEMSLSSVVCCNSFPRRAVEGAFPLPIIIQCGAQQVGPVHVRRPGLMTAPDRPRGALGSTNAVIVAVQQQQQRRRSTGHFLADLPGPEPSRRGNTSLS